MKRRNLLLGGGAVAVAAAGGLVAHGIADMGSGEDYGTAMAETRRALAASPDLAELVRYATLAANGHNTQPWRFSLSDGTVRILPDLSRRTPVVDPDDHHLYASLGCAAANLAIAAAASGRRGEVRFDPAGDGAVVFEFAAGPPVDSPLLAAIPKRQSTRAPFDGRPVAAADLARLVEAARVPGVDLVLVTDKTERDRLRDLVIAGNTAQMADPGFVAELKHWIRFNPAAALRTGDGIFSGSSGNPSLPTWLGPILFDLTFRPGPENAKYARQLDTSAGVAVFVAAGSSPEHWMRAGEACQRFALQATALGLRHSFVNQPVEVADLRPELAGLVGMPGRRPDIVMRFGYGSDMPMSPRRPVAAVLA